MELLCPLSSLLFLLRDSTSKSLLQFLTHHHPRSKALVLEGDWGKRGTRNPRSHSEISQVTPRKALLTALQGRLQKRAFWTSPPFLTHVLHSLPWWHQGQILHSQFISPVVCRSIHLKDTSCWQFQMMTLFIFIIILACVAPTVVNGAIQSPQIRHAIYLNIAVNLTGCIYGVWKMFFCSVLNLLPFKLIKSFCSHLQQLLKRKKQEYV